MNIEFLRLSDVLIRIVSNVWVILWKINKKTYIAQFI